MKHKDKINELMCSINDALLMLTVTRLELIELYKDTKFPDPYLDKVEQNFHIARGLEERYLELRVVYEDALRDLITKE